MGETKIYEALVEACDSDIRMGRPQNVAKRLAQIEAARVPRSWRLPLAKVCRRAGLYSRGLALLARIVLKRRRSDVEATPSEVAEYAALLLRFGATNEAEEFLRSIDSTQAPDALLYLSYAHFLRWEYPESIPRLEQYLQSQLTPYARLVGQTNLAYAMVESRQHEGALRLLNDLVKNTSEEGHLLLECHSRMYRAQLFFQAGDLGQARVELEDAKRHFTLGHTSDHLILMKWDLILSGIASKDMEPLNRLRALATKHHNWEALRDADLYSLHLEFNQERFLHLYFGTPFPRFRAQICTDLKVGTDRKVYVLGGKSAPRFDVQTAEVNGVPVLHPGGKSHQLLTVLLRDFYEPLRIPSVFSALFPGEHYDVASSPDRVRKIIRRSRRWLAENHIPVEIKLASGFYSLSIKGNFSFRIPLDPTPLEPIALHLQKLEKTYSQLESFSAKQVRDQLGLSKSTVQRVLEWGMSNQRIERLGNSSRDTTYRVSDKKAA